MTQHSQWIEALAYHLKRTPLPGYEAQNKLAPPGRQRASREMKAAAKKAAVLCCFYKRNGIWHIALMKRTAHKKDKHGGQISLPGGKNEIFDQSLRATAVREFNEEMGVSEKAYIHLGQLSRLHIPVSDFLVSPFVAFAKSELDFNPDRSEVEKIIHYPVHALLKETAEMVAMPVIGVDYKVPAYVYDSYIIWGATAMILSELKEILLLCK